MSGGERSDVTGAMKRLADAFEDARGALPAFDATPRSRNRVRRLRAQGRPPLELLKASIRAYQKGGQHLGLLPAIGC